MAAGEASVVFRVVVAFVVWALAVYAATQKDLWPNLVAVAGLVLVTAPLRAPAFVVSSVLGSAPLHLLGGPRPSIHFALLFLLPRFRGIEGPGQVASIPATTVPPLYASGGGTDANNLPKPRFPLFFSAHAKPFPLAKGFNDF